MVIDKSTGRGCALSIASKTISRQLIEDGIIGKPLLRKPRKQGYDLVRIVDKHGYYMNTNRQQVDELAGEPLWVPSFIDSKQWERSVGQFTTLSPLDSNVEKFLLPYMDDYLQSLTEEELVAMVHEFLIDQGILNTPIRQRNGKTYYFNTFCIYSLDKTSSLFPYESRLKFSLFKVRGESCFNVTVWNKAATQFQVGMTLDDCIKIFLKTNLTTTAPVEPSEFERLVQHIGPPIYERIPENNDETTFDRIRVIVGLPRYLYGSWEELSEEVLKYKPEILQAAVRRIAADRQFKRYGIPINFLKVSNAQLLRDYSLELIFELCLRNSDES